MTFFRLCFYLLLWGVCASEVRAVSILMPKYLLVSANAQNATSATFIVTANQVGINTAVPDKTLDISIQKSQDTNGLRMIGSDGHYLMLHPSLGPGYFNPLTQAGDTGIIYSGGYSNSPTGLVIAPWTGSAVGLRMTASGNVGIGITNPIGKLEVQETNALFYTYYDHLQLQSTASGSGYYPYISWYDSSGSRACYLGGGSSDNLYLSLYFENSNKLYFHSGNLGIGALPTYPLDVASSYYNSGSVTYGYLNGAGAIGSGTASGIYYSINASTRIRCTEINAFSDARIKKNVVTTSALDDLKKIRQLRVVHYNYIDTVTKGNKQKYGLLAQEVEQIMPDVVHKTLDFIPSVYEKAVSAHFDEGHDALTVTTQKAHGFKKGDLVRVIAGGDQQSEKTIEKPVSQIVSEHTFILKEWREPVEALFVYGKQVNDFYVLDYDQVFSASLGALQALSKKAESQKKYIEQQGKTLESLRAEIKKLSRKI